MLEIKLRHKKTSNAFFNVALKNLKSTETKVAISDYRLKFFKE